MATTRTATARKTTTTVATEAGHAGLVKVARTRKAPAAKATATPAPAAVVEAPAPVVEAPVEEAKAAKAPRTVRFPKGLATEASCTATPACEHTTYTNEDPHCRKPGCANFIDTCAVHARPAFLEKAAAKAAKAEEAAKAKADREAKAAKAKEAKEAKLAEVAKAAEAAAAKK